MSCWNVAIRSRVSDFFGWSEPSSGETGGGIASSVASSRITSLHLPGVLRSTGITRLGGPACGSAPMTPLILMLSTSPRGNAVSFSDGAQVRPRQGLPPCWFNTLPIALGPSRRDGRSELPVEAAPSVARGCPCHLAGRSLPASCLQLARWKPSFALPRPRIPETFGVTIQIANRAEHGRPGAAGYRYRRTSPPRA
jgi:hypothetical protein